MGKGEATRRRIIVEAAGLFNQRGFAGASMQDVMEATGLEKGGLYRHFGSKEELAVEAFGYALGCAVEARTRDLETVSGAVNKLERAVQRFVEVPSAVPGGCPLMNTAVDADDGNPALLLLAQEGVRAWKARLAKIVEEGLEAGEIRKGTDPGRVANTVIAMLEGALMIARLEGRRDALVDARATLSEVFRGLAT